MKPNILFIGDMKYNSHVINSFVGGILINDIEINTKRKYYCSSKGKYENINIIYDKYEKLKIPLIYDLYSFEVLNVSTIESLNLELQQIQLVVYIINSYIPVNMNLYKNIKEQINNIKENQYIEFCVIISLDAPYFTQFNENKPKTDINIDIYNNIDINNDKVFTFNGSKFLIQTIIEKKYNLITPNKTICEYILLNSAAKFKKHITNNIIEYVDIEYCDNGDYDNFITFLRTIYSNLEICIKKPFMDKTNELLNATNKQILLPSYVNSCNNIIKYFQYYDVKITEFVKMVINKIDMQKQEDVEIIHILFQIFINREPLSSYIFDFVMNNKYINTKIKAIVFYCALHANVKMEINHWKIILSSYKIFDKSLPDYKFFCVNHKQSNCIFTHIGKTKYNHKNGSQYINNLLNLEITPIYIKYMIYVALTPLSILIKQIIVNDLDYKILEILDQDIKKNINIMILHANVQKKNMLFNVLFSNHTKSKNFIKHQVIMKELFNFS
jgi:hypothetical protein